MQDFEVLFILTGCEHSEKGLGITTPHLTFKVGLGKIN